MNWIDKFPGLSQLEEPIRRTLVERSRVVRVPKGTVVFGPGKAPDNMLLLLDGSLRVQQVSESGREIVLIPGPRRRKLRADHRLSSGL